MKRAGALALFLLAACQGGPRSSPEGAVRNFLDALQARDTAETAASFEGEYNFMLVEVVRDALEFHAVSRTGAIVDTGTIRPRPKM